MPGCNVESSRHVWIWRSGPLHLLPGSNSVLLCKFLLCPAKGYFLRNHPIVMCHAKQVTPAQMLYDLDLQVVCTDLAFKMCVFYAEPRISRVAISAETSPIPKES